MPLNISNVVLAIFLIAPGFLSVTIAISLGVIEDRPSGTRLLVFCLVSSIFVDSLFLGAAAAIGDDVEQASGIANLFFTPSFRLDLVALLFTIAVLFGLLAAIFLIWDVNQKLRRSLWDSIGTDSNRKRKPWQPWEGTLKDAYLVKVQTSDGHTIGGVLSEYSRAGNHREITIIEPEVVDKESESFVKTGDDSVILLEDDIERVYVRMNEESRKEFLGVSE